MTEELRITVWDKRQRAFETGRNGSVALCFLKEKENEIDFKKNIIAVLSARRSVYGSLFGLSDYHDGN